MTNAAVTLSVVSHGQLELVSALLHDLHTYCNASSFEVILTLNVPEILPIAFSQLSFPVKILRNSTPLGFGENHNRAFQIASGDFFCVINPDIRIASNIFPALMSALEDTPLGVVGPVVRDSEGVIEDSARRFPTPWMIFCKAMGGCKKQDYVIEDAHVHPDWIGGMFMLFRREGFKNMLGFNQKFFLYYEDVDLCARVWLKGLRVALVPEVHVVHLARRSSHRNLRFLTMHVQSMMKFFFSVTFLLVMLRRIGSARSLKIFSK